MLSSSLFRKQYTLKGPTLWAVLLFQIPSDEEAKTSFTKLFTSLYQEFSFIICVIRSTVFLISSNSLLNRRMGECPKTAIIVTIYWAPMCQALCQEHKKQVACDLYNQFSMYPLLSQLYDLSEETEKLNNLHKIILVIDEPRRSLPDFPDSKYALQFILPLSITKHALHNHFVFLFFKINIMAVVES